MTVFAIPPGPMNRFHFNKSLPSIAMMGFLVALAGCGDGNNPDASAEPAATVPSVRALATKELVGTNCAAGGARIDAGLDTNSNGVLDTAEIASTQYVCDGALGAAGHSSLLRMEAEAAGANCPTGGTRVSAGLDVNDDGVLGSGEISGSPTYVCGGASGTSNLMDMAAEAAGANCIHGGSKVTSGLDSNANTVLDSGEITATSYTCNGAPGAGISWIDVLGTSEQASSGFGYLAYNAAQVTITLPTTPAIGDLVEVSGAGVGGWKIAQNASQSILTKALPGGDVDTWTASESNRFWSSIGSSDDGSKVVAVGYGNQIFTSTDSGMSWTARESSRNWSSVASSADGSKLVAVANGQQIYTSIDSGVTWTARESNRSWEAVASSADGSKLVAAVYNGLIYTSTDSGVTWSPQESVRFWQTVTSSADGSKLAAAEFSGRIYTSIDSGLTWTPRDSNRDWFSVATSADGSKLVASVAGGQLYTSTDSGVSWSARESARNWRSVSSSANGSNLLAADISGLLYTSADSGVSWITRESTRNWRSVTSSADGKKLFAANYGGQIYTGIIGRTTAGVSGYLTGSQYDAIRLQYVGDGLFMPLSATSYSGSFTVN